MKIKIILVFFICTFNISFISVVPDIGKFVTPVFYVSSIKQKDLNQTATSIYKITRPGIYYVASDLYFTPTNNNAIGIEIAASNVTLNLNSETLNHNSNGFTGFIMIKLDSGYSNIAIINGKLISDNGSTSSKGIYIDSSTSPVNNITIKNLLIKKFNLYGIYEAIGSVTANNITISNVEVSEIIDTVTGTQLWGFYITKRNNIIIENCSCNNCRVNNSSNTFICFFIGDLNAPTENVKISNCNASSNTGFDVTGYVVLGENISLKNCISCNNTSVNYMNSFFPVACHKITIDSCSCINNTSTTGAVNGFWLYPNPTFSDIIIRKCLVLNLKGFSANGFVNDLHSNCAIYDECSVKNLIATNGQAIGYYNLANGSIYKNCLAQGISSTTAISRGFYSTGTSNCFFEKCSSIDNSSSAASYAIGFELEINSNSSIINCISLNNVCSTGTAAGIFIITCTNCISLGNQLYNNIGNSQYGYYDGTAFASTTNFLAKNVAYGQGVSQNIGGAGYNSTKTNYFIGTASATATDRSGLISDVTRRSTPSMTALDSAHTNWTNISVY